MEGTMSVCRWTHRRRTRPPPPGSTPWQPRCRVGPWPRPGANLEGENMMVDIKRCGLLTHGSSLGTGSAATAEDARGGGGGPGLHRLGGEAQADDDQEEQEAVGLADCGQHHEGVCNIWLYYSAFRGKLCNHFSCEPGMSDCPLPAELGSTTAPHLSGLRRVSVLLEMFPILLIKRSAAWPG